MIKSTYDRSVGTDYGCKSTTQVGINLMSLHSFRIDIKLMSCSLLKTDSKGEGGKCVYMTQGGL